MIYYYRAVVRRGWQRYTSRWLQSRDRLIAFFLQTSVIFLVLYLFPFFGSVDDEAKLAAAASISVIVSGLISLIFEIIYSPVDMHETQNKRIDDLYEIVSRLKSDEDILNKLSDMYLNGRKLYSEYDEIEVWKIKMNNWRKEVEQKLRENYSISTIHQFRKPGSGFEYSTEWSWSNVDSSTVFFLRAGISGSLSALDDIIRFGSPNLLPNQTLVATVIEAEEKFRSHRN